MPGILAVDDSHLNSSPKLPSVKKNASPKVISPVWGQPTSNGWGLWKYKGIIPLLEQFETSQL
jgi:hypothetical protein